MSTGGCWLALVPYLACLAMQCPCLCGFGRGPGSAMPQLTSRAPKPGSRLCMAQVSGGSAPGSRVPPCLPRALRASCSYLTADVAEKEGLKVKKLSGTKFRQMLRGGGFH